MTAQQTLILIYDNNTLLKKINYQKKGFIFEVRFLIGFLTEYSIYYLHLEVDKNVMNLSIYQFLIKESKGI